MNDTIVIQEVINVNAPRIDYMQLFVDSLHLDDPEPPPQPARQPEPPQWLDDAPDVLTWLNSAPTVRQQAENALRLLEVIDMATIVPIELWATGANGEPQYRTRNTDFDVARVVLTMFAQRNKATIRLSNMEIAARVNCSDKTAGKALARLCSLFAVVTPANPNLKMPAVYALTQHHVYCVDSDDRKNRSSESTQLPATLGMDVFSRSLTAISMAEYLAKEAARNEARKEILQDDDPERRENRLKADVLVRKQLRKRLASYYDAIGRDAGRAVELLEEYGSLRPVELAALLHVSNSSCSRTLKKLRIAGLIEDGDRVVTLIPHWLESVQKMDKRNPNTGSRSKRWTKFVKRRLTLLNEKLENASDDRERRYWQNAINKLNMEAALEQPATTREQAERHERLRQRDKRDLQADLRAMAEKAREDAQPTTYEEREARRIALALSDAAAASWAKFNSARSAELGSGWFANMSMEDVLMDFHHFQANRVTA